MAVIAFTSLTGQLKSAESFGASHVSSRTPMKSLFLVD